MQELSTHISMYTINLHWYDYGRKKWVSAKCSSYCKGSKSKVKYWPEYPAGHWHVNPFAKSKHVPLFWHGFDRHSLTSNSQLCPALKTKKKKNEITINNINNNIEWCTTNAHSWVLWNISIEWNNSFFQRNMF